MKKKIIAGASIVALAGIIAMAAIMTGFTSSSNTQSATQVRVTTLRRGDLSVSTSASGMVYSASVTQVSSTLNYSVKNVYVEVGDHVEEGDVLAEVDTSELESSIAQKGASLSKSQASAQLSLTEAQDDLGIYERDLDAGYDSTLMKAQSAVTSAEMSVTTAELDLAAANNDVRTARNNLQDARNEEGDYEDGATDSQIETLKNAVISKETSVEKAQYSLESAHQSLEEALISLEAAEVSSADSLTSYENKVKSAQISANFTEQQLALQQLQGDLEKAVLTAPVSGTVTSVEAVVGGPSSDLLFIIQNTSDLKIVTNIQEYDIGTVEVGNKVIITTESTGELEFEGTLTKISPTSTLTTKGTTTSSTTAEYEAEVSVSSSAPKGLLVGMNALLSIVTEDKSNVYYVPFEAVTTVEGQSVVYAVRSQEDGTSVTEAINVTTGLENEIYIEIDGASLSDGMQIISDASGIVAGDAVEMQESAARGGSGENAPAAQQGGGIQIGMPGMGGGGNGGGGPRG